jgi:raffinose/stachyose/melibiose transport system permease protein
MTAKRWRRVGLWVLALLWVLVALAPFWFMVQTGFKEALELMTNPVWALPRNPTLDNFRAIIAANFFRFLSNSLIVVSVSIVLVVFFAAMAAYVFGRIRFRLNRPLFALIIAGLVVPIHVTLIPVYLLTTNIGLYDHIWALIGPYVAFSLPVSVFILTGFVREIPRELEEAARIDGCSPMRSFFSIVLPLVRPGLATVAVYNAVTLWNEFVFAYVLTSSRTQRTLPLALWEFQGQYSSNIPAMMAVLTMSTLPLLLAYVLFQEQLVKGIMAGAVKG